MATKFYSEISFAYISNDSLGRTAVIVLEQLQNNNEVSNSNMSVKCSLSTSGDTIPEPMPEATLSSE